MMCGTLRFCEPTHWLDYYDTDAILCAWYYTSCCILYIMLYKTNLNASCQMHFIACFQVHSEVHSQTAWLYGHNCSPWHTPSLLDSHSQVSFQDAPKYIPNNISKYVLKYTPGHTFMNTPNCTVWHSPSLHDCKLPIALNGTLPAC